MPIASGSFMTNPCLELISHDVKRKLQMIVHANHAVHGRSCFNVKVAAFKFDFAFCAQAVPFDRHVGGNYDMTRDSVQRQVAANLCVEVPSRGRRYGNVCALEGNIGKLVG